MITNKFLNNKKAIRHSLAFTTALCLSMGALMGNNAFAMNAQDDTNLKGTQTLRQKSSTSSNSAHITAKQLREDFKRSSIPVSGKLKQFFQEDNIRNNKKSLFQPPETDFIQLKEHSVFILSGNIVGMSDLKDKIEKNANTSIFCVYSECFLFDEDFEKIGATLFIDAPHWFVMGKQRVINLRGEDGADHPLEKASNGNSPGAHGVGGLPGFSGKNGGHFYGRGIFFENLENLTINVSGGKGGKGGKGQNGGNGANGADGAQRNLIRIRENNTCVDLEKVEPGDLAYGKVNAGPNAYTGPNAYGKLEPGDLAYGSDGERFFKKVFTYENEKIRELYQNGTRGQAGGNAGAAGEGGKSGQKGSIIINGVSSQGQQYIATGVDGEDGDSGAVGQGGKHGIIFQRTYINERIASTARGFKSVDVETAKEAVIDVAGPMFVAIGGVIATGPVGALAGVGVLGVKGFGSIISAVVHSNWEDDAVPIKLGEKRAARGVMPESHENKLDDKDTIKSQNTILEPLELLQQAHVQQIAELKRNAHRALDNNNLSRYRSDETRLYTYDSKKKNLSQSIAELKNKI